MEEDNDKNNLIPESILKNRKVKLCFYCLGISSLFFLLFFVTYIAASEGYGTKNLRAVKSDLEYNKENGEYLISFIVPQQEPNCYDGNECTEDFIAAGMCIHPDKINNINSCSSPCHKKNQGICQGGKCKGACAGECTTISDCPQINGTQNFDVVCEYGECIYNGTYALPSNFGGICFQSTILQNICLTGINSTYKQCMIPDINCGNFDFSCFLHFSC